MDSNKELTPAIEEGLFNKPGPVSLLKIIWASIKFFFTEKPGLIILTSILLLFVWGYHGNFDLLKLILPQWSNPGENTDTRVPILSWVPWDRELISFWGGALVVVFIPILVITIGFKQPLSDYGLAFPRKGKRLMGLWLFLTLVILLAYPFYIASKDSGMQGVYPFYKTFSSTSQFAIYELSYFPFFLAIEFMFRGYLLFGLADNGFTITYKNGAAETFFFGRYAILIAMLPYTAWHLGKPLSEMWSTPVWGLVTGAGAYAVRSIWPVLMAHWLLNVFLDAMILAHLGHPLF